MKYDEAPGQCEQLRQLIKAGPGIVPTEQQLETILSYIAQEFGPGSSVYEKLADVRGSFSAWIHPQNGPAADADAIQAMQLIYRDIGKLEAALGTHLMTNDIGRHRERAVAEPGHTYLASDHGVPARLSQWRGRWLRPTRGTVHR